MKVSSIRGAILAGILAALGCVSEGPSRLDWVNLPELYTQTTVLFDRGAATPTPTGFHVQLVSLDGSGPLGSELERGVVRTVVIEVESDHRPWSMYYRVEGPRITRWYRSVETPVTAYFHDETNRRLRGNLSAKLIESAFGVDHEGGCVTVRFDVPVE